MKVENFKFISQKAYIEISLAKVKADNFVKLEKVKSLQSVINLLASGYSDKNNQSNSHVKSRLINASYGKNNKPKSSSALLIIVNSFSDIESDIKKRNLKTVLFKQILPATSTNENLLDNAREIRFQRDLPKLSDTSIITDKLLLLMLAFSIVIFLLITILWLMVKRRI